MTSVLEKGESDQKAISDSSAQAMIVKNQKLEGKIRDLEGIRRENADHKAAREKHQGEVKALFEEKQKLYEDIMALKDQISQARGDTKEKLLSIGYLEADKARL